MRRSAMWLVSALLAAGCETSAPLPVAEEYEGEELAAIVLEEEEPPDPNAPPPPAIADTPPPPPPNPRDRLPPPVVPTHPDPEHASAAPVRARRYVYRVRMTVPAGLGDASDRIALPSAELFVDVSHERLRARFAGPGWPVPAGSEVRVRSDHHGVYVFDDRGGRPLEPGELAKWFEGGRVTRRGPPLRVFANLGPARHAPPDEDVPGALVCALLAELAGEPRENVMRRCERGAPYIWRLGFWRAEQTADVPITLPRSALRADEVDPPPSHGRIEPSRAFLEASGLRRISPSGPPVEPVIGEGLFVTNESPTRAIVTVEGVAVGWVDAGETTHFVGLRPGVYAVSSIRPLGAVVQRRRAVAVPGTHRICDGRCAAQPPAP